MAESEGKRKPKSSLLKQLKSTLHQSGLSRTSNPKDPKKRQQQRKHLSSVSQGHRSAKLEAIGRDFNKFDTREENKKFQVVTRHGRTEEARKGAPGKSRAAGVELRKKTLLPLLQTRTHTSSFVDRRFGENSTTLTPEEKALERFTAERQARPGRKARFNLEDGEEEALTHGGTKLGFGDEDELEAGGWGGLGSAESGGASSSNREPLLRRRMAMEAEAEEEPPRKRSRAEIMDEVVAKSKAYKHERQKIRSEDDEVRFQLDAELKDLRMLLGTSGMIPRPSAADSKKAPKTLGDAEAEGETNDDEIEGDEDEEEEDESDGDSDEDEDEEVSGSEEELDEEGLEAALAASGKSGVDRDLLRKLIGKLADDPDDEVDDGDNEDSTRIVSAAPTLDDTRPDPAVPEPKDDDPYDTYVRLLALEPRAHATDRLKTPLELAQDAAKELRAQEEARVRRQRGEEEEDVTTGKKQKRKPQADDLEDDFAMSEDGSGSDEEKEGLGKGLEGGFGSQVIEDHSDEAESGEDDNDSDNGNNDEASDLGDLDDGDSGEESLDGAQEQLVPSVPTSRLARAGAELPFTFPCPETHAEFVNLLEKSGIPEADTATVVKRIRVLYHPGLGEANKGRLEVFTNVLLDHVLHLASIDTPTSFTTINSLLPQLLTLSHAYPLVAAPHYVAKLRTMQKNFARGLAQGPLEPSSKTWPGPIELTLLRLIGMVWSTSDLSHPVAAPALLLISQYLAQSRVRSVGDLATGLFLCTLAAQYEAMSKRLVPEALNFLLNAVLLLLPSSITSKTTPGLFPSPDLGYEHAKSLRLRTTDDLQPRKLSLRATLRGDRVDDQLKVDLIGTTITLLKDMAEKHVSLDAFIELFSPAQTILGSIILAKVSPAVEALVVDVQTSVARMLKLASSTRKPLTLQHHKPIPIATYIPKFDEGYNPNRKFDPDTERNEANKLRSLYKKEKKGAIRELRKDNKFLAAEEQKIRVQKDAEYGKKIAKIMGSLSDERFEEKSHERAKAKGKKQDKARRK